MHKRKILFICEGSSDEPKFLKLMMRKVFPKHKYEKASSAQRCNI